MATALKTPTKVPTKAPKAPAKAVKQVAKTVKAVPSAQVPTDDRMTNGERMKRLEELLSQANSKLRYMGTEIDRLRGDNDNLRRANKIMESRVMGKSYE